MDRRDQWHARVRNWWERADPSDVLVPVTVLPEVCYLLARRGGAGGEARFLRAVATGEFTLEPLEDVDVRRAGDLLEAYRDLPLGFVDASIVAMAERLGVTTILTTDRRHFGVIRPRHIEALRLEP